MASARSVVAAVRLVIFARYPRPGRAKTRLIPALGAENAARLQDAMTRHTLAEARAFARQAGERIEVIVRFAGDSVSAEEMAERYGAGDTRYVDQGEGGLGERLIRAIDGQGPVVVIGTDCPGMNASLLAAAEQRLATSDVVLGPAADGGYYLIAMNRPAAGLFDAIDWSTDRVLQQTVESARRLGLSVAMLPVLSDVDTPDDLRFAVNLLAEAGISWPIKAKNGT